MKPLTHPISLFVFCALTAARGVEVDSSFRVNLDGTVHALAVARSGEVLVGGEFSKVNAQAAASFARLSANGTLEPGAECEGAVFAIGAAKDGTVYLGGAFPGGVMGLGPDGSHLFVGSVEQGRVYGIGFGSDQGLVIGGAFWSEPGVFVERLTPGGQPDRDFLSALQQTQSLEAGVHTLAVQSDGRVLVGGNFETPAGFATLARLNVDGSLDDTFDGDPGPILYPKAITILPDGKILVAGVEDSSGRGFVRRLKEDGSVDTAFNEAALDRSVEAIAVDVSGRVIIGGSFRLVNGVPRERLARLESDGTLDESFNIGANNVVTTLLCDGETVLVGGAFSEIGGVEQRGLARLKETGAFGFKSLALSASGEMHLTLKGETGRVYVVESSNDLQNWTIFKTNTATVDGVAVTASTSEAPRQFFRARLSE